MTASTARFCCTRRALDRSGLAPAWTAGHRVLWSGQNARKPPGRPSCRSAEKAVGLDPGSGPAHAARAIVRWDIQAIGRSHRRSGPGHGD